MKRLFSILILFCLVISLVPSGNTNPIDSSEITVNQQAEQVITYAMQYDFPEYSYWTADSYSTAQWISATAGMLYKNSLNGDFRPDLAIDQPDDLSGLTKIVQLRNNLKFWNGNDLTVDDVVFSYHVALTASINHRSYSYLSSHFSSKDSISVESCQDQTIRFKFTKAIAFWQFLLTVPIIEQNAYQDKYDACLSGSAFFCDWTVPMDQMLKVLVHSYQLIWI